MGFLEIVKNSKKPVFREQFIKKNYPEDYAYIKSLPGRSFTEQKYMYCHNIKSIPICPICGNLVSFVPYKGYRKYCSSQCAARDNSWGKKRNTLISHYGSLNKAYSCRAEKFKHTNLERYGVENPSQSKEIQEKKKQTTLSHYGVEHHMQSEDVKEKIKHTNLERYGVENPMQSEDVKEKIKHTNLERYGVEYPSSCKVIRDKVKQTCLERYGVEYPLQNKDIQNKSKQTCLERYGVPVASMAKSIKEKMIASMHKNNIEQVDDLIGYDDDGNWICKCPHPQCNKCKEKIYSISHQMHHDRMRLHIEPCTKILPIQPSFSTYELQIRSWLDELNIHYILNNRSILKGKELDIYIPGDHLAIEINGCYWHSNACKSKSYHMEKWSQCKERGIKMITLWEDWIQDHPDGCLNLLKYHLGMIKDIEIPWDPNLVDLGLGSGSIKEHLSIHDGYECWDSGIFY